MKLAINAVSANVGGAITYLQNMLRVLGRRLRTTNGQEVVVWRGRGSFRGGRDSASTADDAWSSDVEYRYCEHRRIGRLRRSVFDQIELPLTLRREGFDALFSSANFGTLISPCRQVLLVRNTLYFDPIVAERMPSPRVRAELALQRALCLASMRAADVVLFPTRAMADLAALHTGGPKSNWKIAPYGTRHDLLDLGGDGVNRSERCRLLNVSLYCDQKNLGTLMRAVTLLHKEQPNRYHLTITAGLGRDLPEGSPNFPRLAEERRLFSELERKDLAEDTSWRKYGSLPQMYAAANVFVFPSYTESFGHPLVEAMAAGMPVVASDVAVNRELCGEAAVYFPTFDARACAEAIRRVDEDPALAQRLSQAGRRRAREFTWDRHVDALLSAIGIETPQIHEANGLGDRKELGQP